MFAWHWPDRVIDKWHGRLCECVRAKGRLRSTIFSHMTRDVLDCFFKWKLPQFHTSNCRKVVRQHTEGMVGSILHGFCCKLLGFPAVKEFWKSVKNWQSYCHEFAPDPAGGAYSAPPDPLAGFGGPTSKEREREGKRGEGKGGEGRGREERGEEGRRGERKGGEGRGREGRGGEGKGHEPPPLFGGSLRLCKQKSRFWSNSWLFCILWVLLSEALKGYEGYEGLKSARQDLSKNVMADTVAFRGAPIRPILYVFGYFNQLMEKNLTV